MRRVIAALLLFGCSEPTEDLDEGEAGTAAESSDSGEESGGTTEGDVETACALEGQGLTWCELYAGCVEALCGPAPEGGSTEWNTCAGTCDVEIRLRAPSSVCAVYGTDIYHPRNEWDPAMGSCIGYGCGTSDWPEDAECPEVPRECGTIEGYCEPFTTPYVSVGEMCSDALLRPSSCALEVWAEDMGSHGIQCLQRWECLDAGGDPTVCHGLYDEACAKLGL